MTNFGALPTNAPAPRAGLAAHSDTYRVSGLIPIYGPYSVGVQTYVPGGVLCDIALTATHFVNDSTAVFAHFLTWSGYSAATLSAFALYSRAFNLTDSVVVRHTFAGQVSTVQAGTHTPGFGMAFQAFDTSYIGKTVRFELGYYSDSQWYSDGNDYASSTVAQVGAA